MKYFKYKLIAIIIGLGIIAPGCSNFLEMEPINQTYGGAFWVSEAAAEQAMAGGYSLLRVALTNSNEENRFITYGELNAGFIDRKSLSNSEKFTDGSFWNPDMGEFMWDKFYKVIAQCNLIIHETAKLDENLFAEGIKGRDALIGEAYFLRAFTYFYMTKVWGGVPLVITPTLTVEEIITKDGYIKNVPRNTEKEVLTQCIADLKIAEGALEYGTPGNSKWAVRANKGSVQALMAHVYLWMHMPAESEVAADNMIKNGGYSLVNYTDSLAVKKMFIGRSTEGVFEINIDFDQNESNTNGMAQSTVFHPYIQNVAEGGRIYFVLKTQVTALYGSTDLRLKRFYTNVNSARPNVLKYASVIYEDEATFTNAHGICNILLHRLSDIILLRAEALANLKRYGEARILLNTIRTRAQAIPFTGPDSGLQYEIFLERARELVMEGHSFFDRIRGNEWTGITWMSEQRKAKEGYYWGVSATFIKNNPLLTQNPWWAMKAW